MRRTTVLEKPKRLDKLTKPEHEELVFDLINAFALVKNPTDSALLMHDLLTKSEIKNLSKRLRIAKLILSGKKQEDIISQLHCSFGTVARVRTWLTEGGKGLHKVIKKLPEKTLRPRAHYSYPSPNLPLILLASFQELKHRKETKNIDTFLKSLEEKHLIDKRIMKEVRDEYKNLAHKSKKQKFKKLISTHQK